MSVCSYRGPFIIPLYWDLFDLFVLFCKIFYRINPLFVLGLLIRRRIRKKGKSLYKTLFIFMQSEQKNISGITNYKQAFHISKDQKLSFMQNWDVNVN